MVNIGSMSTGGRVLAIKADLAKIALTSPVCTSENEKLALSRRVDKHWRLIGWGKIRRGTRIALSSSSSASSSTPELSSPAGAGSIRVGAAADAAPAVAGAASPLSLSSSSSPSSASSAAGAATASSPSHGDGEDAEGEEDLPEDDIGVEEPSSGPANTRRPL